MLLRRTLAGGASKLVAADSGVVAGVLLDAVVDELAAAHRVPLVTVSAAADGRVVLGFADGVGPAAPTHYAGIWGHGTATVNGSRRRLGSRHTSYTDCKDSHLFLRTKKADTFRAV